MVTLKTLPSGPLRGGSAACLNEWNDGLDGMNAYMEWLLRWNDCLDGVDNVTWRGGGGAPLVTFKALAVGAPTGEARACTMWT